MLFRNSSRSMASDVVCAPVATGRSNGVRSDDLVQAGPDALVIGCQFHLDAAERHRHQRHAIARLQLIDDPADAFHRHVLVARTDVFVEHDDVDVAAGAGGGQRRGRLAGPVPRAPAFGAGARRRHLHELEHPHRPRPSADGDPDFVGAQIANRRSVRGHRADRSSVTRSTPLLNCGGCLLCARAERDCRGEAERRAQPDGHRGHRTGPSLLRLLEIAFRRAEHVLHRLAASTNDDTPDDEPREAGERSCTGAVDAHHVEPGLRRRRMQGSGRARRRSSGSRKSGGCRWPSASREAGGGLYSDRCVMLVTGRMPKSSLLQYRMSPRRTASHSGNWLQIGEENPARRWPEVRDSSKITVNSSATLSGSSLLR